MSGYDPIVGVRDHLGRIERTIDILADTIFTVVTVLAFGIAEMAVRELPIESPLDWIVSTITLFVIVIAVNGLRGHYGRDNWMNRNS